VPTSKGKGRGRGGEEKGGGGEVKGASGEGWEREGWWTGGRVGRGGGICVIGFRGIDVPVSADLSPVRSVRLPLCACAV